MALKLPQLFYLTRLSLLAHRPTFQNYKFFRCSSSVFPSTTYHLLAGSLQVLDPPSRPYCLNRRPRPRAQPSHDVTYAR